MSLNMAMKTQIKTFIGISPHIKISNDQLNHLYYTVAS